MKGNKIFDFSRLGFQNIINIMAKKINECVDIANGLIPRLDDYISKIDWNKIINSDLYQKVLGDLGKTKEQLEYITLDSFMDLKNKSLTLTNGSKIKTYGYYQANDGGHAEYLITDVGEVDNVLTYDIGGLKAKLINNGEIVAEQIGFKSDEDFDNTPILLNFLNCNEDLTCRFRANKYKFSKCIFPSKSNNKKIKGIKSNYEEITGNTIFEPINNCDYLFDIQGTSETNTIKGLNFDGITFTDKNKLISESFYKLNYVSNAYFNIAFYRIYATTFEISNSWEIDFEKYCCRAFWSDSHYVMKFISSTLNISNINFKHIDLEGIYSTFMYVSDRANMINCSIDYMSLENTRNDMNATGWSDRGVIPSFEKFKELTKIPIFSFGNNKGFSIGILNLHCINKKYYTNSKGVEVIDSIFELRNQDWQVTIDQINVNDSSKYLYLADGVGNVASTLLISNLSHTRQNTSYENPVLYHSLQCGVIDIATSSCKFYTHKNILEFNKAYTCKDLLLLSNLEKTWWNSNYLTVDHQATNSFSLFRNFAKGGNNATIIKDFTLTGACTIYVRLKVSEYNGQLINVVSSKGDTISKPLANTTEYQVVSLEVKAPNDNTKTYSITISSGTNTFIDYILAVPQNRNFYNFKSGIVNVASASTPVTVTFDEPFESTPTVITQIVGGANGLTSTPNDIGSTGFTVKASSDNRNVQWFAFTIR